MASGSVQEVDTEVDSMSELNSVNSKPSTSETPDSATSAKHRNDAEVFFNRKWRMELLKNHHIHYCRRVLFSRLPSGYEDLDTQRYTDDQQQHLITIKIN